MHETADNLDAVDQAIEVVEHEAPGAVDRDVPQIEAAELLGEDHPGHDVGVVLHLGQEHGVAGSQVGAAQDWATRLSDSVVFLVKTTSAPGPAHR